MLEAEPTAAGELARTPLAHLLVYMLDRRLSGALFLSSPTSGEAETVVQIERGAPVKIRPGDRFALLGEMLVEAKAIDQATLDAALATKGLLGDVLLLADRVDRDTLERVAEAQFKRRVVRLFALPASTGYRFYEDQFPLRDYGGDDARVDPLALLWAGLREHAEASAQFEATLARLGDTKLTLHASASVGRFGLDEEEEAPLLDALVGAPDARTLDEMFPTLGRRFAYALVITRQLAASSELLPCGVEVPPSGRRRAVPTSLGRVALRSTLHREGAAAPDAAGAGERPTFAKRSPSAHPGAEGARSSDEARRADDAGGRAESASQVEEHPLASLSAEELRWLAAEYVEQRDFLAAVEACAAGRAKGADDADLATLDVWARAQLDGADVAALTSELDAILGAYESHANARFYRALLLNRLGDHASSALDLERVLEIVPDHEAAKRELSKLNEESDFGLLPQS